VFESAVLQAGFKAGRFVMVNAIYLFKRDYAITSIPDVQSI